MKTIKTSAKWVDLEKFSPHFKFDIRYARSDNFFRKAVYPSEKAFILDHVAEDLWAVAEEIKKQHLGLLIFDAYRPWDITKLFWDSASAEMRPFLADPKSGSSHNRGCAVDLSMYSLKTGLPVEMPSDFDEMNEKAHVLYAKGSPQSLEMREILQSTMKANGFKGITHEWWHFNHVSHSEHPVMNLSFDEMIKLVIK